MCVFMKYYFVAISKCHITSVYLHVELSVDPCSNVDASAIELSKIGGAKDCRKLQDTRGRQYSLCCTKVACETVLMPLH